MRAEVHVRLVAHVEGRLALARAATPGPWRYNPAKVWHAPEDLALRRNGEEFVGAGPLDATVGVAATGPADDPQAMADAHFIADHDPTDAIARHTAALERLEEHRPIYQIRTNDGGRWMCKKRCRPTCREFTRIAREYEFELEPR